MPDQTSAIPASELYTPAEGARAVFSGAITPEGLIAAANRGDLAVAVRTQSGRRLFSRQALENFKKLRLDRDARRAEHGQAVEAVSAA